MKNPCAEVLGVYPIEVTEALLHEQVEILYDLDSMSKEEKAQAERECREQLEAVVLVEALVRDRDDRFDLGRFTQPQVGVPEDDWQAPWAEAYLTLDGEALMLGGTSRVRKPASMTFHSSAKASRPRRTFSDLRKHPR